MSSAWPRSRTGSCTGIGSRDFVARGALVEPRASALVLRHPQDERCGIGIYMIDLHMHTTASDGTLTPEDLVARVREAGITTFSITDHDTMASVPAAAAAAASLGLACVPGIEITTVHGGHDV